MVSASMALRNQAFLLQWSNIHTLAPWASEVSGGGSDPVSLSWLVTIIVGEEAEALACETPS